MPFLNNIDGNIFYRHWPTPNASTTVLVLHGYGEHSGHYRRLAAHLCRAGADVWSLDHVGHGLTSAPSDGLFNSVKQLSDNAATILKTARVVNPELPMVIVGHSLGAATAVMLSASKEIQIDGLVLTGAPIAGSPPAGTLPPDPIMSQEPSYLDELAHDPFAFDTAANEPNLWQRLDEALPQIVAARDQLGIPVLLIYGEHDVFTTQQQAQAWTETLTNGQLITVSGGHHDIVNDVEHQAVADHITGFMETVTHRP